MLRIAGWVNAACERKRACVPPPRLCAARRVTRDHQPAAALAEVTAVRSLLRDFPQTGETDSIRVKETTIALAVTPPAKIGVGRDRSLRRIEEGPRLSER